MKQEDQFQCNNTDAGTFEVVGLYYIRQPGFKEMDDLWEIHSNNLNQSGHIDWPVKPPDPNDNDPFSKLRTY